MGRGLTHPTAHIDKVLCEITTQQQYKYVGYQFFNDIEAQVSNYKIIKRINAPKKTGALFIFEGNFAIVYYARAVTGASQIKAGDLGMIYSEQKGATEHLQLYSERLTRQGELLYLTLNSSNTACRGFSSHQSLQASILDGLLYNERVDQRIRQPIETFFADGQNQFDWNGLSTSEVNEIGKYVGELLIGSLVLDNKIDGHFNKNIFDNSIDQFIVPCDPSFSGIDSVFLSSNGAMIPISSKLGRGAKASFFTNLLPKVLQSDLSKRCIATDIANCASEIGITYEILNSKRGSKQVCYQYGIRNILQLPYSEVSDCYKVFQDIKKGIDSREVQIVVNQIKRHQTIEQRVKDNLPLSVTAAFTREIARLLNQDLESRALMIEILSGKQFVQANLSIPKWKRGDLWFDLLDSSQAKITFIGNKAAICDIDAVQGMVNYELTY